MPLKRGGSRLWFLGICCAWSASAAAATFTVTSTADSGAGTLRSAIGSANITPGLNYIYFNISPPGVHVISLSTYLPVILNPVIIDGRTQPGYGTPVIELDGSSVF